MDAILWIFVPILVASGSAILSYFIMQSRLEVAVAETNAKLRALENGVPDKIRAAEESAQRRAFDQFLTDFRVEERRYLRQSGSQVMNRKSVVLQERLYFRNIPLSNWVEHEMVVDGGATLELLDKNPVFSAKALSDYANGTPAYLAQ